MSRIRSKNTRIEVALRKALFARGLRFRLHAPGLPGRPDIIFTAGRVAVFVDGDFWHGYNFEQWRCKLAPYWAAKITRNMARDAAMDELLRTAGWRVVRVWEHEIKSSLDDVADRVAAAIRQRILDATIAPRRPAMSIRGTRR